MSVQGLWTVDFQIARGGRFSGVIVLQGNKVFGGDSQYYYVGTYKESGGEVEAEAQCTHYAGAVSTAFGTNENTYSLKMQGKHSGDLVTGEIWRPDRPNQKLPLRLVRRAQSGEP